MDVLKEYEEINMKFMDEEIPTIQMMQKLMDRQALGSNRIDALDAVGWTPS